MTTSSGEFAVVWDAAAEGRKVHNQHGVLDGGGAAQQAVLHYALQEPELPLAVKVVAHCYIPTIFRGGGASMGLNPGELPEGVGNSAEYSDCCIEP